MKPPISLVIVEGSTTACASEGCTSIASTTVGKTQAWQVSLASSFVSSVCSSCDLRASAQTDVIALDSARKGDAQLGAARRMSASARKKAAIIFMLRAVSCDGPASASRAKPSRLDRAEVRR